MSTSVIMESKDEKQSTMLQIMLVVVEVLVSKGLKQATAVMMGFDITKEIGIRMGGELWYFPKGAAAAFTEKAAAIYEEFSGGNIGEIADKYGLTTITVYAILKRKREEKERGRKMPNVATIADLLKNRRKR